MKARDLRKKTDAELGQELLSLRKEQFNLRMQRATGQLSRPDQFGKVRKSIAQVKTLLSERGQQAGNPAGDVAIKTAAVAVKKVATKKVATRKVATRKVAAKKAVNTGSVA